MISQFKHLLATILMIAFLCFLCYKWWTAMQVWRYGTVQDAFVTEIKTHRKTTTRKIQSGARIYEISFSKKYPSGEYLKVGDDLRVRIHPDYDIGLREDENPNTQLFLIVPLLVLTGWVASRLFRATGKTAPLKPKQKRKSLRRKQRNLAMRKADKQ